MKTETESENKRLRQAVADLEKKLGEHEVRK